MTATAKSIRRRDAVDAAALARRFPSLHPVLARVYAGRSVRDESELDYSLSRIPPPDSLRDIDAAAGILADAVEAQAAITVVGDYDVDGATSTALMKLALEACGAAEVRYFVPDRFTLGYGLSAEVAEAVAVKLQPDVLVTVDNGISSHAGVDRAHEHGITVIVTDHHLPGDSLPRADAVVNPSRTDDGFPDKTLAGVGVAFYVLLALRARLRERGWFKDSGRAEPNLADYLDLVALGTIADMVPLQYLNRILVRSGMARICAGRCRPGIRALLKVSALQAEEVTARDIGFRIAPRLNAAGRLAGMNIGVDCLLGDDEKTVNEIAAQLDELNRERRSTQEQMQAQAEEIIGSLDIAKNGDIPALCLYDPRWHQGVIGLVASRLKDAYGCPCVVFAGHDEETLKGSARSIRGVHVRDLFAGIAARRPDLINHFGGHAMAAGLSIRAENFAEFAAAFTESAACHAEARAANRAVDSDGALGEGDLCLGVARQLAAGGPWGQNFPEPLFDNEFEVRAAECVKSRHLKLQLALPGGAQTLEAMAFSHLNDGDAAPAYEKVHAAYRLDVNTWRGEKVQLVIEHLQPL
ncbi:MAG: single-stranded-DNA-specific exonuclease RecJ [Gammaproteobacteria bacterium]|nr:single-stranded-DNA-specific exonuclease RecJ [Gammaproteobacteria bacterium]MDD9799055.1 single-stranded-DNA-specific exonuclease RecJ [Gammaproteobacteria bacterium]